MRGLKGGGGNVLTTLSSDTEVIKNILNFEITYENIRIETKNHTLWISKNKFRNHVLNVTWRQIGRYNRGYNSRDSQVQRILLLFFNY